MSKWISLGPLFEADICSRKHKGNPESVEAFQSIKDRLTRNQNAVLRVIKERGERGATTDEIADYFGVGQNVVSGRVSELHFRLHKIEKIGTRPTRSGHPAAVWKAV